MKNLLIGNGINIQFDRTNYTSQQIVLKILKNCDRDDFPKNIIIDRPFLLKNFMGQLFLEAREIILGKYDRFACETAERKSLIAFKKKYFHQLETLRITDIGFEDYYLIHDLVCHKTEIHNPEQFYVRESMKVAYLYAIYNDGKLNQLYKNYPFNLTNYLKSFDNIFTTNYDSNIESAIGKKIYHIHGQFDKKSDVYIESSFRNQLPDAPIKDTEIDENYFYLYSNALTTYCGEYKEFQIKQHSQANSCVEKMALLYRTNPSIKKEIDEWTKNRNTLTANLGYAIQLKAANPTLSFSDDYYFNEFKAVTGTIEILGLSPWNDFHIFEVINSVDLDECVYYYLNDSDCDEIRCLLPKLESEHILKFKSLKEFWREIYEN